MKYARIQGVGGYLPSKVMTNHDFESIIETTHEWILERTGIERRHIAAEDETTATMASRAAAEAIERAGIALEAVDMIIVATCTPDKFLPSTACLVQELLGIKRPLIAFDVSAACAGFIYALSIADQFIRSGMITNALVIGSEVMSRTLDWQDRATCVLFGDGAGAVLLAAEDKPGILSTHLYAQGQHKELLKLDNHKVLTDKMSDTDTLQMEGREVFRLAVKYLGAVVEDTLQHNGMEKSDIDWLIPHQANIRIIESTAKRLNMPLERVILTVQDQGNTSAASVPLAMHTGIADGRIKPDDILLLEAIGGGMTWGSALVRY